MNSDISLRNPKFMTLHGMNFLIRPFERFPYQRMPKKQKRHHI